MIRIAIVGTSKISDEFAKAIEKVEGCELKVIYSRDLKKGLEFGKRYGVDDIVVDFQELCKKDLYSKPKFVALWANFGVIKKQEARTL